MRCAKCGAENPAVKRFCGDCGAALANRCAQCGADNPPEKKFCGDCGTALEGATTVRAEPDLSAIRVNPETPLDALGGERKTVTALFADIRGSMELIEDLDPEEARAIIDPALQIMIEAVGRYAGYVVQSTGDGIFALFGAPVAHEDHPQRALYAALRLQEQMRSYADQLRSKGQPPVQARVGVNTGEVVVRTIHTGTERPEYTPIGHSTSLAARMQTLAPIGSIAVTAETRKLCEGYFAFKSLGPTIVKGVSEAVEVHEVTGLGPLRTRLQASARRGLTKFVGRQREMEAMKAAADQAQAGHGQIVAAMAEPGVGKSRLLFEFKATSQAGWMVLETVSVSHGKASAYLPVIDLLRNYFRIASEDDERTRREKVNGKILTLDRALEDTLPYLFSLLGIVEGDDPLAAMDAQLRKRRTLEAIKRMLLRESLNQPLIVIFEDLHWIDGETQAFLNLLADSIGTVKILLLVNYRPEYSHHWNSKTYYTQLRLDPLGKESAEEMLAALLGAGVEVAPLKHLIIEKTEGNPFFMEEMVLDLFDKGALVRNGAVKLARPLGELRVPTSVQAILAARLDRLPPDKKDLLQTLAVLGKEFTFNHVKAATAKSVSELERMLSDLQLAEFIYEQPATGDIEFTFKHALTQEVAYNSILGERRKQIHERAAQAIESLFAANLADYYDDLAHHYGRSGNATKAVNYLRLAAGQAMNRSAYVEASGQLNRALELLSKQPDEVKRDQAEIAVRLSLAICMMYGSSFVSAASVAVDILERTRELCEKVGDQASLCEVLDYLTFQYSGFEPRKARALSENFLEVATRLADPEMVGRARFGLARSLMWEGNFIAAIEEFEQASQLAAGAASKCEVMFGDWQVRNRSLASLTLWILGYPERALVKSRESLTVARQIMASSADLTFALFWSAFLNLQLRDAKTAYSHADEALRLALENGLTFFLALNGLLLNWALAQMGQIEEGLSEMLRWRTEPELMQTARTAIPCVGLADISLAAGRPREGLGAVAEGLELGGRIGTKIVEAEMRRLKGELILMSDNSASLEATECFRDAIEVARRQSAKSWELRATMSLARLLAKQGRRNDARTMLADIYGWFTEGFDNADLRDAKALLDEFAG